MIVRDFWLDSCTNYEAERLNGFLQSIEKDDSFESYSLSYYTVRNYLVVVVEVEEVQK